MDVDIAAACGGTGRAPVASALAPRAAHAADAPGHVPAPRRPTGTDDGQERGWVRGEEPTPQEPGTRYFNLDDNDSVPELGGSRPDRFAGVRPQERVPRHIVEQIVDSAPVLPLLHALVPQTVDSVGEVLKILDKLVPDVEQVIDVPMIYPEDFQMRRFRSSLLEPQMAEQLVEVPVIEHVRVAPSSDAWGLGFRRISESVHLVRVRWPRAVYKYWAQLMVWTSLRSRTTSSSSLRWTVDGASLQFLDRVVDIAVMLRDRYAQCQTAFWTGY